MLKTPEAHALSWPDGTRVALTEMEYQIIERLRWGRMNGPEMSRDLGCSRRLVDNYLSASIYPMLGVHSRLHAVMTLMSASVT